MPKAAAPPRTGRLSPSDLKQEMVSVLSLKPHPQNPRRHDDDMLQASVEQHGVYRSIVVSKDDYVLCGHGTLSAAIAKDEEDIWVTRLPLEHDDPQAIAILLMDNKSSDGASYSDADLASLLQATTDLNGTGWDQSEVTALLLSIESNTLKKQQKQQKNPSDPVQKRLTTVKVVFAVEEVSIIEKALAATGEWERGLALSKVCSAYLKRHKADEAETTEELEAK